MPDFFQELLDWVDQPPPPRGRDTHAISFNQQGVSAGPNLAQYAQYTGLMFFRPQGTGHGPVGSLPGLTGVGRLVDYSDRYVGPGSETWPFWVKVDVMFRLPEVFASLHFLDGSLPEDSVRVVEVDAHVTGHDIYLAAPPERWILHTLRKTTVLYGL